MIHLHLNDLSAADEQELAARIEKARGKLRLSVSVENLYRAASKSELAGNWLKSWYLAEALARYSSNSRCEFAEGSEGTGELTFQFQVNNAARMAASLIEFAPSLDPDNFEAAAFLIDEAEGWLEEGLISPVQFPELERCFREDASEIDSDDNEF